MEEYVHSTGCRLTFSRKIPIVLGYQLQEGMQATSPHLDDTLERSWKCESGEYLSWCILGGVQTPTGRCSTKHRSFRDQPVTRV